MQKPPVTIDMPLFTAIIMLCALSMLVQYSATGENLELLGRQGARIGFAFMLMLLFTRIPTAALLRWSPWLYGAGLLLLVIVLVTGIIGKGAQRWLDLGVLRFQPAEMMKLAVPMMVAWILTRLPLPPRPFQSLFALAAVLLPFGLVVVQPDLGTAILIAIAGIVVIFLAGVGWKPIVAVFIALSAAAPVMWVLLLRDYQRQRVLTLFDPWADPLGAGYHIVQSIIAVGSGGLRGKGWLAGTQSRLDFIPERSTDFIFAIYAEEFGFLGNLILLLLYLFIGLRGLVISYYAHDSYARLLGSGLSITFFVCVFVNIGMAAGILPVVGVPLPLLSHGGSSMAIIMIGFGILMSINQQRSTLSKR